MMLESLWCCKDNNPDYTSTCIEWDIWRGGQVVIVNDYAFESQCSIGFGRMLWANSFIFIQHGGPLFWGCESIQFNGVCLFTFVPNECWVNIKHGLVVILESVVHCGCTLGRLFHLDSLSDVQCVLSHIWDSRLLPWFSCLSRHQFGLCSVLTGIVRLSLGGLGHHRFGTGLGRLFLVRFGQGRFLCVAIVSAISLFLAYRVVRLWYHRRKGLAFPAAGPFCPWVRLHQGFFALLDAFNLVVLIRVISVIGVIVDGRGVGFGYFSYSYFISCGQGALGRGLISHFLCGYGQFCVIVIIIFFIIVFAIILFPGVIVQDGISIWISLGDVCRFEGFFGLSVVMPDLLKLILLAEVVGSIVRYYLEFGLSWFEFSWRWNQSKVRQFTIWHGVGISCRVWY